MDIELADICHAIRSGTPQEIAEFSALLLALPLQVPTFTSDTSNPKPHVCRFCGTNTDFLDRQGEPACGSHGGRYVGRRP